MFPSRAALRRLATACLAAAAVAGSSSVALADPVSVQDLQLLLQGGVGERVILRHLQRWGLEHDLQASELVALKRAGASDSLLEALAGTRSAAQEDERVVELPGEEGVLFTNLDERGRRIGGEDPETAPVNRMEGGEPATLRVETAPGPALEGTATSQAASAGSAAYEEPGLEGFREEEPRWGTPGGYTRFKMYYSRAPYGGFRTWVFPVYRVARVPILVPAWGGVYAPAVIPF
jgi:hypothetical protein